MAHCRSYSEGVGVSQSPPPSAFSEPFTRRGSLSADGAHPGVLYDPPSRRGSVVDEAARVDHFEPSFVDIRSGGGGSQINELAKSFRQGGHVEQQGLLPEYVCLLPSIKTLPFNC